MVDPIAVAFADQGQRQAAPQRQELTSAQVDIVNEILSGFDSSNLSADDLVEINAAFESAGITPSSSLRETIETAGFDPEELAIAGPQAPPQGAPAGPPPPSEEFLDAFTEIIAEYDAENLTEQDIEEIVSRLADEGFTPPSPGAQLVQIDA